MRLLPLLLLTALAASAQPACPPTPAYSQCELAFDLDDGDMKLHPNPHVSLQLQAEFRGPRHKTYLMPAFYAGSRKMIIRFAPNEPGEWVFRVTSNLERLNGQTGTFEATPSEAAGFVRTANLHHWATLAGEHIANRKPHLWMGDTCYRFAFLSEDQFRQLVDTRAEQGFTHIRGIVIGGPEDSSSAWPAPDSPNPEYFNRLDARIRYMNSKGIVADLILAGPNNHLTKVLPNWDHRQRYLRYLIARYSSMNITWQGFQEFESYENGKPLLKEIGTFLKQHDPYQHVRSSGTRETSAALGGDQWMNYVTHSSGDDQVGAIEYQLYPAPFVNLEFAIENSGAGGSSPKHADADTFRRRLWNATMNGQYPTYNNSGTSTAQQPFDAKHLHAPGAQQMAQWFKFFADTRYWELIPYFDVDGARALALEGVEYILYVEKPGPVEIALERHTYDASWFNPITGEVVPIKKFKTDRWTGEPPNRSHDWVLHIEREGRKQSMLSRYRFDSRQIPIQLQEPEQAVKAIPFDIVEPGEGQISISAPSTFAVKLKRETRATRRMMYLWTGDVPTDGLGYRVLATGPSGTLRIPRDMVKNLPATLSLRVTAMNALGKVYISDRVFKLVP
jgi:hypothetical protein